MEDKIHKFISNIILYGIVQEQREKENEVIGATISPCEEKWVSPLLFVDVDLDLSWDAMIKGMPACMPIDNREIPTWFSGDRLIILPLLSIPYPTKCLAHCNRQGEEYMLHNFLRETISSNEDGDKELLPTFRGPEFHIF